MKVQQLEILYAEESSLERFNNNHEDEFFSFYQSLGEENRKNFILFHTLNSYRLLNKKYIRSIFLVSEDEYGEEYSYEFDVLEDFLIDDDYYIKVDNEILRGVVNHEHIFFKELEDSLLPLYYHVFTDEALEVLQNLIQSGKLDLESLDCIEDDINMSFVEMKLIEIKAIVMMLETHGVKNTLKYKYYDELKGML